MSTKRDNNFTDNQLKWIGIAVKTAKKIYPFIKGWKLTSDYERYDTHLYIDLIVDFEELYDFYGIKMKDYFINKKIENPNDLKTSALLAFGDWGEYNSEEYNKMADKSYNEGIELKKSIEDAYTYIPEDMVINYGIELYNGREDNRPVKLTVSDFVQQVNG
jgi:hypothetical protein